MSKESLFISLILFIVGTIILSLHKGTKEIFSLNRKIVLIYILCSIIIFALIGLLTMEKIFSGLLVMNYIIIQGVVLGLAILHLYLIGNMLKWEEDNKYSTQLIFTLVTVIYSSIGYILVARNLGTPTFAYYFWIFALTYFIAYFYRFLWQKTVAFPTAVYQKWYYPMTRQVVIPDADSLRNPRIVSLFLDKNLNSAKPTIFKAKAPEFMSFGKFFFLFINDYNLRTPESQIEYKDANNQAYGWFFYVKPNFIGMTRSINPELTIQANRIKEHSTIMCIRSLK
jgi:hypothetical protein